MRAIENRCRGCASPAYPCTAPYCDFFRYEAIYCDKCNVEAEDYEEVDGKHYCKDCFEEIFGGDEE